MDLAREGVAVIVVSSDLEEVLGYRTASWSWHRANRPVFWTARTPMTSRSWNWPPSERKELSCHHAECAETVRSVGECGAGDRAGSGIGQRIAMGLAQCGADVALLDRRTDDGLAQTADFIARAGRRSIQIAADVTQSAALNDAVARTEAELGALSLAVNAAGIANANPPRRWRKASSRP